MDEELYPLYHREEDSWWWSAGRRALVTSLWRRYGSPRTRPKLLEVGCGTGGLLQELSSWAEAYGLDLAREAVGFCQERGIDSACQGSVNTLPFPGSFRTEISPPLEFTMLLTIARPRP